MTASGHTRKLVEWAAAPPRSPNLACIYGLADPRAPGEIRYVGQTTKTLDKRLYDHLRTARGKWGHWRYPVYRWIRSLLQAGYLPLIAALEHVPAKRLFAWEKYWTEELKRQGHKLLNLRKPGEWHPSALARRRMSLAKLGKKASAATRRKMSRAGAAAWKDPAIRGKRIAGMMGHKYSPATLRRMSLAAKGRVIPPPQRRKISQTLTGKKQSLETRKKRSRSLRRSYRKPSVRRRHLLAIRKLMKDPQYLRNLSRAMRLSWARRKKRAT